MWKMQVLIINYFREFLIKWENVYKACVTNFGVKQALDMSELK